MSLISTIPPFICFKHKLTNLLLANFKLVFTCLQTTNKRLLPGKLGLLYHISIEFCIKPIKIKKIGTAVLLWVKFFGIGDDWVRDYKSRTASQIEQHGCITSLKLQTGGAIQSPCVSQGL